MISENFTTKYFTETIPLQAIGEGAIDVAIIKAAFLKRASRELPAFSEGNRHQRSLEIVSSLVNTPRRFHRFEYALGRRLPGLLHEVDNYDLLLIAALEACDAAVLRLFIENGNKIFVDHNISDELNGKIKQLDSQIQKEAFEILVNREKREDHARAAAKEHWGAAFFGIGPFISIMKWVKLLSDKDEENVIQSLNYLLAEVTGPKNQNYEIVTDTLRDLFEKKYDVVKDSSTICKIIQEVWRAQLGPLVTPPLARIVQKNLALKPAQLRFDLLKTYLSLKEIDYSFPGRLFFYLVENQERGQVVSDLSVDQVCELSKILVREFLENLNTLELSENCLSYLYRVKWAANCLGVEDPTIAAVVSKMKNPKTIDSFVNYLLSLRYPWQPIFSDNHVDLIHKLIGLDKFLEVITCSDFPKLNQQTVNTLNDFKQKYDQVNGNFTALIDLFD